MSDGVSAEQLRSLLKISRALAVTVKLDTFLPTAVEIVTTLLSCERASVYIVDASSGELWTQAAVGAPQIRLPAGRGLAGAALMSGEASVVPDAYADARFDPTTDAKLGFRTRDIMTVAMFDLQQKPVGVIQAINSLKNGFTTTDLELLKLVADQGGVAVQRHRLADAVRAADALRREMDLAAAVQMELLPKSLPVVGSIDVAGWSVPASVTGGDCYDVWQLADGRMAILLADAAGHGIAPAMVVTQVRSLVRLLACPQMNPAEVLNRVNARLAEDLSPHRFVTAALAYLSADGVIDLASAGHGPILVSERPGVPAHELSASGLPLVIDPEPSVEQLPPIHLQPGGQLVLMSDGIFEAPSRAGELLGIERVESALRARPTESAMQQIDHVRSMVRHWEESADIRDDQTIVIARRV